MQSPRIARNSDHYPSKAPLSRTASDNPSVQEVLDIVHSQKSNKGSRSRHFSNMGRFGQTVPLPAISNASLPVRPSTSFGDRPSSREYLQKPQSHGQLSRSFPPPISPTKANGHSLGGVRPRGNGPDRPMNDSSGCVEDRPTRPHTSYGRRRAPVHRTTPQVESNKIVIPTCPVTSEFRSSSSLAVDRDSLEDEGDAEIMRICKSRRKGSKKKERERCSSPVKNTLIRKSSVE